MVALLALSWLRPLLTLLPKMRNRHFLAIDLAIFLLTPVLALALREDALRADQVSSIVLITLVFAFLKLFIMYRGGLYSRYWLYASVDELGIIVFLGLIAILVNAVAFLALYLLGFISSDFPRSLPLIDGMLTVLAIGGTRYSVRVLDRLQPHAHKDVHSKRVIVAGAGWGGVMMVREMQSNPQVGLKPVAFLDDDPTKKRLIIRGVPVLGTCSEIGRVFHETGANQVVIAMPTAPGNKVREIVEACERAGVQAKTMPGMYELLDGRVSVKQLRNVEIEDLLRRDPIRTDLAAVGNLVRGKRVLVTGGGGSIGSELCRQIVQFSPECLVILGHGENSVFEIQNELERKLARGIPPLGSSDVSTGTGSGTGSSMGSGSGTGSGEGERVHTSIRSVIADIRFLDRMHDVFEEHKPQVVFHAAAHKHVPLMELNPTEAVTNNVLGTRNLLECSRRSGAEHFVMISSDKAVNPTGIMGASKRVAELLLHQAASLDGGQYCAVRFGNVLGSRGSVVLTFKQQIADGGPVTITHPDMTRYFMTIPEAVQLVLQAAALGRGGGEVFMLDMGEPVKVVDMARDLIELSGLVVDRDIQIKYTGVRPGEKLYEEMFLSHEDYARTEHEKIYICRNASHAVPDDLESMVDRLHTAARANDSGAIVDGLSALVPEYKPASIPVSGQRKGSNDPYANDTAGSHSHAHAAGANVPEVKGPGYMPTGVQVPQQ